jgi:hypothetical protein
VEVKDGVTKIDLRCFLCAKVIRNGTWFKCIIHTDIWEFYHIGCIASIVADALDETPSRAVVPGGIPRREGRAGDA